MADGKESTRRYSAFSRALLISLAFLFTIIVFSSFFDQLDSQVSGEASDRRPESIFNTGRHESASSSGLKKSFPFVFHEDHSMESLSPLVDPVWNEAVSTKRGGFLWVRHNETFSRAWGVSMFHAIHCLGMLRSSLQKRFVPQDIVGGHANHDHGSSLEEEQMHVEHCLGYVARSLLCSGDDTLEPPIGEFDDAGNLAYTAVDGEDVQHQCRDSSLAWQTILGSEQEPIEPFDWKKDDTVRSVFGSA